MDLHRDISNIWIITPEERKKHDLQFFQLNPIGGFLNGDQVKYFFLQSNLPTPLLGQIWQLSDLTADGRFDQKEFSIAMHLIRRFFEGVELPQILPSSLLIEPLVAASPAYHLMGYSGTPTSLIHPSYSSTLPRHTNTISTNNMRTLSPQSKPYAISVSAASEWAIPQTLRLRYKQTFNAHDHAHKGYLTGLEAKNILSQSGLTHSILAQIWSLADVDTDGNLSPDEFCIAMHLIDEAKGGRSIPQTLPADLLPPSSRRHRRSSETVVPNHATLPLKHSSAKTGRDTIDDLLTNFPLQNQTASLVDPNDETQIAESDLSKIVTFEDKRKENFDKGQAELEKRRQMLVEMQQQESRDRLAAEKAELERREKIRLEQEAKKQLDMDRQLEKQKRIEMEREEQRRKAIEQREAARRDMERQRHLEWEKQRQDQLSIEKQRELALLEQLRHDTGHINLQLDTFITKKDEMVQKLDQAKRTMADFESSIDVMRHSRDSKMAAINKLQTENEEWEMSRVAVQQECLRISKQVNTPNSQTERKKEEVAKMHASKKSSLEMLRKQIEEDASESKSFNQQINDASLHLNSLNESLQEVKNKCSELQATLNIKKQNVEQLSKQNHSNPKESFEDKFQTTDHSKDNWFSTENSKFVADFDAWNPTVTTSETVVASDFQAEINNDAWPSSSTNILNNTSEFSSFPNDVWANFDTKADTSFQSKIDWAANFTEVNNDEKLDSGVPEKYQAIYNFDARNVDELSMVTGDIILVYKKDQEAAEPGWLIGHIGSRHGCFPASYAAKQEDALADSTLPSTFNTSLKEESTFSNQFEKCESSERTKLSASAESPFVPVAPSTPPLSKQPDDTESGLKVLALYAWQAKKENHLSFKKGDIIVVTEQQDTWWSGTLNQQHGWFPKSYVKIITGNQTTLSEDEKASKPSQNNGISNNIETNFSPNFETNNSTEDLVVALHTYSSTEPTDLCFKQGDVFSVKKTEGDWWTGSLNGKTGIFPANYVQKIETMSTTKLALGKKPEIAQVIAAYEASSQEQLSLQPGQLIHVRKKNASGWWEGELQAKGQKRRLGWFPADYVKLLGAVTSVRSTPDLSTNTFSVSKSQDQYIDYPSPSFRPSVEQVVSLFAYKGQQPDELSFEKGMTINVIEKQDSDWWKGEVGGVMGMFPANYVTPMSRPNEFPIQQSTFSLSTS